LLRDRINRSIQHPSSASLTCFFSSLAYFEGLGLVRQVLAPASANKRHAPQWQGQKAKGKVERINHNDMSTKGPSVDPAVFL
jgi:hypothetical protein